MKIVASKFIKESNPNNNAVIDGDLKPGLRIRPIAPQLRIRIQPDIGILKKHPTYICLLGTPDINLNIFLNTYIFYTNKMLILQQWMDPSGQKFQPDPDPHPCLKH